MPEIGELKRQVDAILSDPDTTHGLARALRVAVKEADIWLAHQESRAEWPSGRLDAQPTRVQIGGGGHRIDGFFNIDIVPPADAIWDVREGIPLTDDSVETVFSEHFLEHIDYPRSAKYYAAEAHRVLAPGGRVITGVPDAAFFLSHYPSPPSRSDKVIERWYGKRTCREDINTYLDLLNYVFRDQDDAPNYTPHLWAYDHEKLVQLFKEAGFRTTVAWSFDPAIANPKRQWGSVYVVATK